MNNILIYLSFCAIATVVVGIPAPQQLSGSVTAAAPKLLYVWVGAEDPAKNDYVAVLNFDIVANVTRKDLLKGVPIDGIFDVPTRGNEPHHAGLSADGRTLAVGGLFSSQNGVPDTYFFDLSTPRQPKLTKTDSPQFAGWTDEFVALPDGGFLVTYLTSRSSSGAGRLVKYDKDMDRIGEFPGPNDVVPNGFNPHGCEISGGLIATSDFLDPGTGIFGNTVRIWDSATMKIIKTFTAPASAGGLMALATTKGVFYTTAMGDGKLYLADPNSANLNMPAVLDFGATSMPHTVLTFRSGTRALVSLFGTESVALLNTDNPAKPKVISTVKLPAGAQPHIMRLSKTEQIVAVTCYFLPSSPSDQTLRFLVVAGDKIIFHPVLPVIDFKTAIPDKGKSRPHGVAFTF